jgi:hypothetical protein
MENITGYDTRAGNVSGNSMAMNVSKVRRPFAPYLYNEDRELTHESLARGKVGLVDDYYYQNEYNPFNAERAQQEEFGETVINMLEASLVPRTLASYFDAHGSGYRAPKHLANPEDRWDWEYILERRRERYLGLIDSLSTYPDDYIRPDTLYPKPMRHEQQEMLRIPLQAGLDVNCTLEGQMFVDYRRVWNEEDLVSYQSMVENLPAGPLPFAEVCARVGLERYLTNMNPRDIFRS